ILFPIVTTLLTGLLLPSAVPLIGMLMLGNLFRESGVVDRLLKTSENSLLNIVTIFLGVAVGASMTAENFLKWETIGILVLGFIAFGIGTAAGVLFGKLMAHFSKTPINPLIGAAGVSAVPMAARVVQKVGAEANPQNFLLMHAMGPNVAGVIGSAIAAGVLLSLITP
ncbi:MAG: sodium ion-translocating decarboxylase subunit beta, partial [bacterium]